MARLAKLYDFALGLGIGSAASLLIMGRGDVAMVIALAMAAARLTIGHAAGADQEPPHV